MNTSAGGRVLMLLENHPYPQDRRVAAEAASLTRAGYRMTVIAPATSGQPFHEIVDGVRVYRFPQPPAIDGVFGYLCEYTYSMAASFAISLIVFVRHGIDLVHAHNPPDTFVFIGAFYKLFGKRFLFDHHDLSPEMYCARFGVQSGGPIFRALVWLEKLSCRFADHIIATNESYRTMEMQRDHVPQERITIVRNGPDLDRLRPVEPDPALRKRGGTIIGYVGVMGFQDGVDYLLRALRHLVYDLGRTDFCCVLIGTGDAWARLKALASDLGLDDYVWFTGRISDADLVRYLCAADICVDPDPSNPFTDRSTMIKMMEYMALEKPIVAFDLPEHRFTAADAALYVPPNDELEFARVLAHLMDHPEQRRTMASFGRRRAESVLAWAHSVPSLLKAYRELLPGPAVEPARARFKQWRWWLRQRSLGYIALRSISLTKRYGVTSPRAKRRVLACVRQLASHGCHPTFPIPGWVVRKYGEFSRTLQAMGAELAIHGYQHVDFRSLSLAEAGQQFARAAAAFHEGGIRADGFRCPYLSATEELPRAIPDGLIHYSSNRAIWWDAVPADSRATAIFDSLRRFYRAESSDVVVAVPKTSGPLIEIPVSLPDDLQLSDGLKLDAEGIERAWTEILHQVHRRGELFVALFHPESYDECEQAFENILREARRLQPAVWITQLRDVSRWWQEKAGFSAEFDSTPRAIRVCFRCTERATILIRDAAGRPFQNGRSLKVPDAEPWDGRYQALKGRTLELAGDTQPFVGLSADVPSNVVSFLKEQGYILDQTDTARRCGVYLNAACLRELPTEVQLIDHIECSPAPLVRFWRWPNDAKSGLCLTGDIDALSLVDYAARLVTS